MNVNLHNLVKRAFTLTLVISPFLNFYDSPINFLRMSMFSILLVSFIIVMLGLFTFYKRTISFFVCGLSLITLTFISLLISQDGSLFVIIYRVLMVLVMIALANICIKYVDIEFYVFCLKLLSGFSIAFLFYQIFSFYVLNVEVNGYIPFLNINGEQGDAILAKYLDQIIYRPSSFFIEPSHFGLFISYSLLIILFYSAEKEVYKYLYICMFLFASMMSTSATSVFLVLLASSFYLVKSGLFKRINIKVTGLIVLSVLFGFALIFHDTYVFSRFIESSTRIYGFADKIVGFGLTQKIFGVGLGNQVFYFENILFREYGFVSGLGSLVTQAGYLGLIVFFVFLVSLFNKCNYVGRSFLIMFIAIMFSENVFFSLWMLLFLIFVYDNKKERP